MMVGILDDVIMDDTRIHPLIRWSDRSKWIEVPQQKRSRRALEALLFAAVKMFARDGYEATTIASIAAEAGVTVASLYRRFADKSALFRALVDIWSRSWTADSDTMWREVDWSSRSRHDIIQFHIDLVFSAYRADPDFLCEIDQRCSADAHLAAIMAEMECHGANSFYQILLKVDGPDPDGALREKVETATWILKAAISPLLSRNRRDKWPFISPADPVFKRSITIMTMALFDEPPVFLNGRS